MFQVVVKGRTLEELKSHVSNINNELNGGDKKTEEVTPPLVKVDPEWNNGDQGGAEVIEKVKAPKVETVAPRLDAELDVQGIPHDIRIHAASFAKVANGTWRTKRGVDKDLLAEVIAELKAKYEGVAPPITAETLTKAVESMPSNTPVVPPVIVEAPAPLPTLNVVSGHTVETFKQNFAMLLSSLINEGKIDQPYVEQLKAHFGVGEIWELNDEQKEQLFTSFVSYGFIQSV